MRLLGLEITRAKAAVPANLQAVGDRGNWWWPIIREPFVGAWQRNMEQRAETVLTFSAVYACVTLIASDVAKMRLRLVERDSDGIWSEIESPAFSPVLRKPNHYQNRIKFIEQWVVSKLLHGNTYALKVRDARQAVVALYILDPTRTKPLVTPNGDVYYELRKDNLSRVDADSLVIPASEIIHDTMVPLWHPLCGVTPLTACGLAAVQGLAIQRNSSSFFQNGAQPGGVLTAPGHIEDDMARRLKEHWDTNYTGDKAGKVVVLGDGLKYEAMSVNAVDSQLIEQLRWTAETVCSSFHVPPYMIGVGPMPSYNNVQALNQQYYSQALQGIIENLELCLDEGLGLGSVASSPETKNYGTEFDLDDLLRMDTATQVDALGKAVGGSIMTPNAALKKLNQRPVKGGDTIYMQQQNYSLAALSKRDSQPDPFAKPEPAASQSPPSAPVDDEEEDISAERFVLALQTKFADASLAA